MDEAKKMPAGETQPAGQSPALQGACAGREDWAKSRVQWMLENCIALKMRELEGVMRALMERRL